MALYSMSTRVSATMFVAFLFLLGSFNLMMSIEVFVVDVGGGVFSLHKDYLVYKKRNWKPIENYYKLKIERSSGKVGGTPSYRGWSGGSYNMYNLYLVSDIVGVSELFIGEFNDVDKVKKIVKRIKATTHWEVEFPKKRRRRN